MSGEPRVPDDPRLPASPGTYRIDPVHSFAQFSVKHLLVGRVDGRFGRIEGRFAVTDDVEPALDDVDVTIDASSIDTNHDVRDNDLRGPRFFDVSTFPTLAFRGRAGRRNTTDPWALAGHLTLRGTDHPVEFDVVIRGMTTDQRGQSKLAATATTELSRAELGLTTELESESGVGGGPDIWVRLDIEAIQERG